MNLQQQFQGIPLSQFLLEISEPDYFWLVKRFSGNDTGLTGGHQAGVYLTRVFCESVFPDICTNQVPNPRATVSGFIASDNYFRDSLQAIYYNSKVSQDQSNGRNEYRLTGWGGGNSPTQNTENTGTILVIAGKIEQGTPYILCWIARNAEEEDEIETWLGEDVEPGEVYHRKMFTEETMAPLRFNIPEKWLTTFPTGAEIFDLVVQLLPQNKCKNGVDKLLIKRRDLEFRIFQHIEYATLAPIIHDGFRTVDAFLECANKATNRRKSRSGASLERNLGKIFQDSELQFETQVVTEHKSKVDFLFPSKNRYVTASLCNEHLFMMAAKTCCKDRWRQVLSEAKKIRDKHLFTLQQGISVNQLTEMFSERIKLVVPEPNITFFPEAFRERLITLKNFVEFIQADQRIFNGEQGS